MHSSTTRYMHIVKFQWSLFLVFFCCIYFITTANWWIKILITKQNDHFILSMLQQNICSDKQHYAMTVKNTPQIKWINFTRICMIYILNKLRVTNKLANGRPTQYLTHGINATVLPSSERTGTNGCQREAMSHFRLPLSGDPWWDPWGDHQQNLRYSVQGRPQSHCKISAKSIQQFRRRASWTDRQTANLTL